ncbi:MAG: hypothetical protein K2X48_04275 [Chitinophagaceae bacterium]|nr:hypothetical protein [Chitinophagaceae bacterium]
MTTVALNRTLIKSIYGDQVESASELFILFVKDFPKIRHDLLLAFQSGQPENLIQLLHYHAPSFTYMGLPVLTFECQKLEEKCTQQKKLAPLESDFFNLLDLIEKGKEEVVSNFGFLKIAV